MVEHSLRDREVMALIPGRAIPKALKMVPVATLLGAQHYKDNTGFSSPYVYRTTNIASLTKKGFKPQLGSPCCVIEQVKFTPKSTGNTQEAVAPSQHD